MKPRYRGFLLVPAVVLTAITVLGASPAAAATSSTERISVNAQGVEGDSFSFRSKLSADGRIVAFESYSDKLVPGDGNYNPDVFLKDRRTGTLSMVSVTDDGSSGSGASTGVGISPDGTLVGFSSTAANLVPGDTNFQSDLFVRDVRAKRTELVSTGVGGVPADGSSGEPVFSGDNRYVAFVSTATNLVPGDTNATNDVFVKDRRTGRTDRVSLTASGDQVSAYYTGNPSISADGRWVTFVSYADNLTPGDTNSAADVFVKDRWTGRIDLVSNTGSTQANTGSTQAEISADGRFVTFTSTASNLVAGDTNDNSDVFLKDRWTGRVERISVSSAGRQANYSSEGATLSANGRFVSFVSTATNLLPAESPYQNGVYLRDTWSGRTSLVSATPDGTPADSSADSPDLTADGRLITFSSSASNLVAGDTNRIWDVFTRKLG